MKILVTGSAGFLGSHVVDSLIRKHSVDVVAVDDLTSGYKEDVNQKARFKIMNLKNLDKMTSFLKGCGAVIHCAESEDSLYNVENTFFLLEAMRKSGVKRIVNISSGLVYGSGQLGMYPVSEDVVELKSPNTKFAASKLTQEILCNQFAKEVKGSAISLRTGLLLGPRARYNNFASVLLKNFILNEPVILNGSPKEEFDLVHVYDVRDLVLAALFHIDLYEAEAFNAGTGKSSSTQEVASYIQAMFKNATFSFNEDVNLAHKSTRLNMHKASRELSFIPRRSIADAINDELVWLNVNANLERWKGKGCTTQ
jgi:nucleoside-diphosphate-sugar epimerase